jgi:hypothetical protein
VIVMASTQRVELWRVRTFGRLSTVLFLGRWPGVGFALAEALRHGVGEFRVTNGPGDDLATLTVHPTVLPAAVVRERAAGRFAAALEAA